MDVGTSRKKRRLSIARLAGGIGFVMQRVKTPFAPARTLKDSETHRRGNGMRSSSSDSDADDAGGDASGSKDAVQNPMGGGDSSSSDDDDDDDDDAGGDDKAEGGGTATPAAEPPADVDVTDEDPFADLESAITGGGNTSPDSESEQEEEEEAPAEADAFGDLEAMLG